eukprot:6198171-Pleurochrysis_carterae.AAC.2
MPESRDFSFSGAWTNSLTRVPCALAQSAKLDAKGRRSRQPEKVSEAHQCRGNRKADLLVQLNLALKVVRKIVCSLTLHLCTPLDTTRLPLPSPRSPLPLPSPVSPVAHAPEPTLTLPTCHVQATLTGAHGVRPSALSCVCLWRAFGHLLRRVYPRHSKRHPLSRLGEVGGAQQRIDRRARHPRQRGRRHDRDVVLLHPHHLHRRRAESTESG